jgi:hypothetical protein
VSGRIHERGSIQSEETAEKDIRREDPLLRRFQPDRDR